MATVDAKQETVLEPGAQESDSCEHHWVIASPAGPVSRGVCRLCGAERDFQNYMEGAPWGYDISLEQLAAGSRIPTPMQVPGGRESAGLDEDG